jgi:bifunctional DNA-binding transcriptional regulator/antitoxin component of YhaV-PrlF toxin-antitoxin module
MTAKVKSKRKGRTSSSKLSSKNQVTIPIEISRVAGFTVGDELTFRIDEGRVVIEKDQPKILGLIGLAGNDFDNFDWEKELKEAWGE